MHLSTVAKYIRRSPYQAISASLIMTLTFFMISIFAIFFISSVRLINYFEGSPQLSVFFKDTAKMDEINSLKKKIEDTGKITSVKYVSKEEALKIYKEQNKSDPLLLDLVTADILPASLDIQAVNPQYLSELATAVKGSNIVEEVIFQKDMVDTLTIWTGAIRKVGISLVSILLLESILIVITIVGFKITIRKDEIEIMKLIGASNWFIRIPFLLEGMLYGVLGAIFGWLVSFGIIMYVSPYLQSYFSAIPVAISPILMLEVLLGEIIGASLIGIFASYLAVLRYLK